MYEGLKHAHSGLRWIVLLLLLVAIVNALTKLSKDTYKDGDRKLGLFAMIFTHIQLLIGLVLYFISPKVRFDGDTMSNSMLRFFTVEHSVMMLLAVILITIGYSRSKKAVAASKKYKTTFWFYLIGLLLILAGIPWPFRSGLGGAWF